MQKWDNVKKDVLSLEGAYIHMKIFEDGGGSFSLEDRIGWRWSGDDDEFLLGVLRVCDSSVAKEFYKELEQSDVTKTDIKRAILRSLQKNPKDGLYALIGDNSAYMGYDNSIEEHIYYSQKDDIQHCLERNFYDKEKAEDVADDIVEKMFDDTPSREKVFEDYESELAEQYKEGKTWKQYVTNKIMKGCEHHKTAKDYMQCVFEGLDEEKERIREGFDERLTEELYGSMSIDDDELKEITEKHEIPLKVIDYCAHGGYETLEESRPISEKQSFLESFGARL